MKKIVLAFVLVLALVGNVYAQDKCYSSGLKTADELVVYGNVCFCGIEVIPAAADSTVVVYRGTMTTAASTSGTVIFKGVALASTIPGGAYAPFCVDAPGGIYVDITGAAAAYVVWYR